jgi:hypothetical protein
LEGPDIFVQLVRRGGRTYVRLAPATIWEPTAAQAKQRRRLGEASRQASKLAPEQAAALAGGRLVYVNGRPAVEMPDGRLLTPQQAAVAAMARTGRKYYREPKWLAEYRRRLRAVTVRYSARTA